MPQSSWLLFAVLPLSTCTANVPVLIEFRLAHDEPAGDREPYEFQGDTLYLESAAVLSDPDLEAVSPVVRPGRLSMQLEFTPDGEARLNRVTGENIGNRMALVIDSRVLNAPTIRTAVGSPLDAAFEIPTGEAEEIAQRLRARWP